jgi:8-amino-7-oxononanoate synthase
MGQLQEKYKHYREPQKYMEADVYPYFRAIEGKQGTEVEMGGHKVLMFGSNAYTGLTGDQRIIDAAKRALDKYGSGCAGSRFLNGTLDLHVQLEKEISEFIGKDDCLCFSTGFSVNQGVLAMVVGKDDYIICDDRDHASIVDGRRLSFAKQLHYKHNDMDDLERVLKNLPYEAIKLIVVDGVFSMEGDLAKLPQIVELKHKYNCSIMVDEAHGLGVFGRQGRGVCDHFGLTDEVDLIMGTFSKSLASIGGFIAGASDTINYLRHSCRTYIFSASDTPAATAAAREALHIIQEEPERIEKLWEVTRYALQRFREEGFEIGETESPIIPLYVRDYEKTFRVTKLAFDGGAFINSVVPPACAPQDTLVRFALMATHTKEQVERGVQILKKIFVDLDIIK